MYYLLTTLLEPFILFYLLTTLAIILLWLRRPQGKRILLLLTLSFAGLSLAANPIVAHLALGSLEWSYPPTSKRPPDAQAVVVLSGYAFLPDRGRPEPELAEDTLYRCLHAARLYHSGSPCLVVTTGGKLQDRQESNLTLAGLMRDFLRQQGVADHDLLAEEKSTTTYENARNTAELLCQRGIHKIVLVTEAIHLRRAERCFEAQGLEVVPSGCYYRATEFRWGFRSFLPDSGQARQIQRAAHEWLGILWYRLSGKF